MTHLARRTILAAAVAGLLSTSLGVAGSGAASAAPRTATRACTVTTLPFPADVYRAEASAVDPTGRFVAGTALRRGEESNQLFLLVWRQGRLTTVESPLADSVADVNSHGVVVGNGWAEGRNRPWVYRNGTFELLPSPSGSAGATAINAAGDIVGSGEEAGTGRQLALRWPAARPGTVEVLDVPATAWALGVTRDGTVVGTSGDWETARWSGWARYLDGRRESLTVPGARSVNVDAAEGHWAVGRVDLGGSDQMRVRWDLRDRSWSRLADELPWVADVNARGVVVGGDRVVRGGDSRVLPGGGDRIGVGASAIADTGAIVGFRNDHGRVTPVRWTGC
ncbi:hypothetical protein [Micromonospora coxensis]|uniref:Extracellular repeat, HAF family n=1 Tax=Micromonospora coxensis TaxID=356852 RepID=A0A1C5JVI5_9ACTN|nr:hypothetical protein [Micromonospora coxensis]SCG74584.1 hypothetical protein GA0070614_5480 [Micromonospora coxensis]